MPKTDINTILKNGANTQVKSVDYSTPEKKQELKKLKAKSEQVLKNKEVNWYNLSRKIIKNTTHE